MVIFHSYVSLPEGTWIAHPQVTCFYNEGPHGDAQPRWPRCALTSH